MRTSSNFFCCILIKVTRLKNTSFRQITRELFDSSCVEPTTNSSLLPPLLGIVWNRFYQHFTNITIRAEKKSKLGKSSYIFLNNSAARSYEVINEFANKKNPLGASVLIETVSAPLSLSSISPPSLLLRNVTF